MKKLKLIALAALAAATFALTGCGMTTIEPGYTGIKINKVGSDRGVSKDNIVSGLTFYFPLTTKVVEYPTFNQRVSWTAEATEGKPANEQLSFNTKDQIRVDMDASLNYNLIAAKVPEFYVQYRADDISQFTHGFLRDTARNAVTRLGGEYPFEDLNGAKKEEFLNRVEAEINKVVNPYGVVVKQFASIGALRPPEAIQNAVVAKTKATQDAIAAENQLRTIKANAAKAVEEARGEAEANRLKTSSITPALIEWKRLELREKEIAKWKGEVPSVVTSGSGTMFNLGVGK